MPIIISTMGTLGGTNGRDPTKPCNLVDPCYVLLGSAHVSPSSYALYITAIAVLVQVRYMLISLTSSPQYSFRCFLVCLFPPTFNFLQAFIYIQLAVVADHSSTLQTFLNHKKCITYINTNTCSL